MQDNTCNTQASESMINFGIVYYKAIAILNVNTNVNYLVLYYYVREDNERDSQFS